MREGHILEVGARIGILEHVDVLGDGAEAGHERFPLRGHLIVPNVGDLVLANLAAHLGPRGHREHRLSRHRAKLEDVDHFLGHLFVGRRVHWKGGAVHADATVPKHGVEIVEVEQARCVARDEGPVWVGAVGSQTDAAHADRQAQVVVAA